MLPFDAEQLALARVAFRRFGRGRHVCGRSFYATADKKAAVVQLLLDAKADRAVKDSSGKTAADYAEDAAVSKLLR